MLSITTKAPLVSFSRSWRLFLFTRAPEDHGWQPMDEWSSVRDSAPWRKPSLKGTSSGNLGSFILLILVLTLSVLFSGGVVKAATFSVTNTNDSGAGSLRQAIIDANNTTAADTITFSIGSGHQQIVPASALPPITQPVTIDGTTQPIFSSAPLIELSGNGAGAGAIGLRITGNGAGSTIKGLIINRFSSNGIFLDSSNNTITGNYIGTTFDGTAAAGNSGDGIGIFSGTAAAAASGNTIGGSTAANRNVISGNGANGITINAQDGGTTSNNIISGNYIGANATGTAAIANVGDGVLVNVPQGGGQAQSNTVGGETGNTAGGACTGSCNLISGNGANGVGLWHSGSTSNSVIGNYIGTNAAGSGKVPNGNIGVEVNETANNTVGGATSARRNVISGNAGAGVFITGAASTGNVIGGNYIGTNAAGTSGLGNTKMGIGVGASPGAVGAHSNTIGGYVGGTPITSCIELCNLISGNGENGIFMSGSESYGQQILTNFIGTNANGTGSIGNTLDGIGILNVPNTVIGDGTAIGRNIIAGNGSNGIIIVGGASTGNRVQGNVIGMKPDGTALGNTASGVAVSAATDTAILGNSIAFNSGLGIDLDNNGSTNQNDAGDSDSSANRLQNFPNIYGVHNIGGNTKIGGQFNSVPSSSFRLEFFSNDGCNGGAPNNFGEGQTYLGSIDVNTDQFGNTAWGYSHSTAVAGNKYITATATKKSGTTANETSEFSQCILVNAVKPALSNGATWFLKYDLTTGPADLTFGYGFPSYLLMCAWDPNQLGVKLPVIFSSGTWYMRASYTTGTADLTVSYGGSTGDRPVCGDWNGDGVETVGVFSNSGTWQLRNSNSAGAADLAFSFGSGAATPLVGDWNGDGTDTVGTVDSSNNWSLRNNNSSGAADASFNYGFTPGYPIVGDWDGDGTDTVGSVSTGGTWAIRNANSAGAPNGSFQFGFPGATPLAW